jgi:hypothetical protein
LNHPFSSFVGSTSLPPIDGERRVSLPGQLQPTAVRDTLRRTYTTPGRLTISPLHEESDELALRDMLAEVPPDAVLGSLSPRRGRSLRASVTLSPIVGPLTPIRPDRPSTSLLDDSDRVEDVNVLLVPAQLASSGIAYPEQLPLWVRTMREGSPVIDLRGEAKGGLGLHPVSRQDS